jgi:hypothetical protein
VGSVEGEQTDNRYWLIVSLERLILDLEFVQEFAETKNKIITGFISLFLFTACRFDFKTVSSLSRN